MNAHIVVNDIERDVVAAKDLMVYIENEDLERLWTSAATLTEHTTFERLYRVLFPT